jgi:hypothetical protein
MSTDSRRFLIEQLELLLVELRGAEALTADFLRAHLASIDEHGRRLMAFLPAADHAHPYLKKAA